MIQASFGFSEELNTRGISRDVYVVDKKKWDIIGKTVLPQKTMLAKGEIGIEEVIKY